ncbi:MAG TPA: hypothetical protein VK645_04750 [Chitinophagaceae bacterium]|nr:hypothetical protein [Chitinophagaceae bacterium]
MLGLSSGLMMQKYIEVNEWTIAKTGYSLKCVVLTGIMSLLADYPGRCRAHGAITNITDVSSNVPTPFYKSTFNAAKKKFSYK